MTNPNDSAFAIPAYVPDKIELADVAHRMQSGLTKREYFAAMALQGLLGAQSISINIKDIASDALLMADALIDELNKK